MSEALSDLGVAEAPAADVGDSPSPAADSGFDDNAIDALFGVEPETVVAPAPDVPTVPDPPVPHQDAEVKPEAEVIPETVEAEAEQTEKPIPGLSDKLNWDDENAPKQFREEHKALREAYIKSRENDLEHQFINSPQEFAKRLLETSPTSYSEVGKLIASEGAKANPQGWIQYFINEHPDMVASALTGRELTADRLKAELSVLLDDDDPDVQAALEKEQTVKEAVTVETPEQAQMREFLAEREQQKYTAAVNQVFEPIGEAVDELVSQAGLEIKESEYKGKPFDSLDAETQKKVMVNTMLPAWIDFRANQDPKNVAMQNRVNQFLATKDENGKSKEPDVVSANKLQHHMKIVATNYTNEFLSLFTGLQAKAAKSETAPPSIEQPKPQIRSAGAAPLSLPNGNMDDLWTVKESDLVGLGR